MTQPSTPGLGGAFYVADNQGGEAPQDGAYQFRAALRLGQRVDDHAGGDHVEQHVGHLGQAGGGDLPPLSEEKAHAHKQEKGKYLACHQEEISKHEKSVLSM